MSSLWISGEDCPGIVFLKISLMILMFSYDFKWMIKESSIVDSRFEPIHVPVAFFLFYFSL